MKHSWQFVSFGVQLLRKLTHLGVRNCLLNHIYLCLLKRTSHQPGFVQVDQPQVIFPESQLNLAWRRDKKNFAPYFPYQKCLVNYGVTNHQHKLKCSFGWDSKGLSGKLSGGIGSRNGQKSSEVHCHYCQPNIDRHLPKWWSSSSTCFTLLKFWSILPNFRTNF